MGPDSKSVNPAARLFSFSGVHMLPGNTSPSAAEPTLPVSLSPNSIAPAAAQADGLANPVTTFIGALNALWNGAAWDRMRSGAAAVIAAFSSLGAALSVSPGNWSQGSTPAAATQATTSRAAGGAGVRHVCTGIFATLATGATAQAAAAVLVLRDGLTGAGAILWTKQSILPVNGVWNVEISGLNIVGSAATAMTLEFVAAGVAGSFQSVSMTGYEAS